MCTTKHSDLYVYLLAGVKTSTCSFNACKTKLEEYFNGEGIESAIHVLFPYGDISRSLIRQVLEVRSDLSKKINAERIGGNYVFNQIKKSFQGKRMLLIGHSGGGAAAYQAGKLISEAGIANNVRIVQIGSPRMAIDPNYQDKVSYFHSINDVGKLNDPISRIGSWGGWSRNGSKLPRWNASKYAPGFIEGIRMIGGHADYFRNTEAFMDAEAVCNLDKTIDRVRMWLSGWL